MMKVKQYTAEEARILAHRSLDELLTAEEQSALKLVFEQYPELQQEVAALKEMKQLFTQLSPAAQTNFVEHTLQKASQQMLWYRPLLRRWSSIAAAACIAFLLALGFIYGNSGSLEPEALLGLEDIILDDAYAFE